MKPQRRGRESLNHLTLSSDSGSLRALFLMGGYSDDTGYADRLAFCTHIPFSDPGDGLWDNKIPLHKQLQKDGKS